MTLRLRLAPERRVIRERRTIMSEKRSPVADAHAPVASELPAHGYVITKPVRGSNTPHR